MGLRRSAAKDPGTPMPRRFAIAFLIVALASAAHAARAQDFAFDWNPRTGDAWMDGRLGDINAYGYRYREPFIDELARYYGAPRDLVFDLVVNRRWAPGDAYYACAIAQIVGRPCRHVADVWQRDHAQGWGAVAQGLGVTPGSPEFHRLKRGVVPTYDRWSRPIELDGDLAADFPGRAKSAKPQGHGATGKPATRRGKPDAASAADPKRRAAAGKGKP